MSTDTTTMRVAPSGATRHSNDSKPDYRGFLSPRAIRRFGAYLLKHQTQADGQRRASDNWKKGMPIDWYTESLIRHMHDFHFELEAGNAEAADELACAIWFNLQGYLHEREKAKATTIAIARRPALRGTVAFTAAQLSALSAAATVPAPRRRRRPARRSASPARRR